MMPEEERQSRLALDRANTGALAPLRDLVAYTRDGEWGAGEIDVNLIPMRVIRGTDFNAVRRGSMANVPTRYISPEVCARKTLKPWDILIETAGGSKNRPTGRTLLIHPQILKRSEIPVTCASFARFLRIRPDRANPAYVYWFLQNLYAMGEMEKHQVQHTGVARFQFTRFAEIIKVPLPPAAEQRAIAHVLGTLDDKIELNRGMNETLEEMARALFKSWFVDFDPVHAKAALKQNAASESVAHPATIAAQGAIDYEVPSGWTVGRARAYLDKLDPSIAALFPDRFVDSELGEIPEGWEVKALGDCFNLTMGQSPPGRTYNDIGNGLPFFQGNADFGFRYPERRRYCSGPTRIAHSGDTIVSVRAPVGAMNMAWEECCIGRGVAAMRHVSGLTSFTYYSAWGLKTEIQQYEHTGTVFGAINKKQFENLKVIHPIGKLIEAFDFQAQPLDELIRSNESNSRNLADQRDALLPKLVSGAVKVVTDH